MQRGTFEKFTLLSALILMVLMAISPEASAQSLSTQMTDWIDSGRVFKTAAMATGVTFLGIKFVSSGEKTL